MTRLIEEACALALVGAGEQGVVAHVAVDPGIGSVLADRVPVQQVLINLMRNAREAMQQSDRRELTVEARAAGPDTVEIAVSDTGPGIADEIVDQLFQPFVTTKKSGMGVGLSICRTIVEAHGGRLSAERNAEGGATFRLILQAAQEGDLSDGT